MPSVTNDIFDLLDQRIERCLEDEHPENALIDTYFEFWAALKQRVGTSSGFTGLSEYVFFRYILRSIEQRTNTSFKVEKLTNEVSIFRSDRLLLTHDVDIARFISITRPMKTDIAVLSCPQGGSCRLLAAFELKVYVSSPSILKEMLDRFEVLGQHTHALLIPVLFGKQYLSEMNQFLEKYPGRAFLVSKTKNSQNNGLDQVIDRIMDSL